MMNIFGLSDPPEKRAGRARGELASAAVAVKDAKDALTRLVIGRHKLADQVESAERIIAEANAAEEMAAAGIVDQIRNGLNTVLTFARRPAPLPDLAIAKRALARADAEIEGKRAALEAFKARLPTARRAVLRAQAESYADQYEKALADARLAAARLAGLEFFFDPAAGRRRVALPLGFSIAGDPIATRPSPIEAEQIAEQANFWRAFDEALATDPEADAAAFLHDDVAPCAGAGPAFHELYPDEQRLIAISESRKLGGI